MPDIRAWAVQKLHKMLFELRLRDVRRRPALRLAKGSDVILLSLLRHGDVTMYLVAAASFMAQVPVGRVVVCDDGSLTAQDRELLARAVPGIRVEDHRRFRSPECPTGGCWERLLAVAAFCDEGYVVQLDADTVTLGPLEEVARATAEGTGFTLGTGDGRELLPMEESARRAAASSSRHVQMEVERAFTRLAGYQERRYVRGCAGFAGFPRGGISRASVEALSRECRELVGSRWDEWGSEQVASNLLVAAMERAMVLPLPKYCASNEVVEGQSRFVHFIGYTRFFSSQYANTAVDVMRRLQDGSLPAAVSA